EENIIKGSFIISGTYKMTESSINVDSFNYDLPFEISIDKKYDTQNLILDINDFYYEVIDSKILAVNIEVLLDNLKEKELIELKEERGAAEKEETDEFNEVEELLNQADENKKDSDSQDERQTETTSLFDNLDDNEKYVTYKIHFVNENDTVESIIQKYDVPLSKIEEYNDLTDIQIGNKIIIPTDE
ncbi:MAG: LysM peptidoglycan-binding domain-containing protein, partial [Bacilli bacterium]|nr:LysM peptidoglycan-binding domain-containing protein [Bacilli bacterium]